ncbi:MAG: LytR/AlgR family response regulator transcription factor [Bacteroidia bacterium]
MIRIAIVDDEPLAREVLVSYVRQMEHLELAGTCKNAFELLALINQKQVDVVLLDIDIPEISGIDFIRSIKDPPLVIFTTAYPQYALESYELNAIDYLVKPISLDRFVKAIHKLPQAGASKNQLPPDPDTQADRVLFVRSEGKWIKIDVSRIWFIEGVKDYIRLWMDDGRVVIHSTMKNFEEQIVNHSRFIRVHKSFIVNLDFIEEIDTNSIKIKDQFIAIGGTYRDEVHSRIDGYKLR